MKSGGYEGDPRTLWAPDSQSSSGNEKDKQGPKDHFRFFNQVRFEKVDDLQDSGAYPQELIDGAKNRLQNLKEDAVSRYIDSLTRSEHLIESTEDPRIKQSLAAFLNSSGEQLSQILSEALRASEDAMVQTIRDSDN